MTRARDLVRHLALSAVSILDARKIQRLENYSISIDSNQSMKIQIAVTFALFFEPLYLEPRMIESCNSKFSVGCELL
jgi:hypothetical protein